MAINGLESGASQESDGGNFTESPAHARDTNQPDTGTVFNVFSNSPLGSFPYILAYDRDGISMAYPPQQYCHLPEGKIDGLVLGTGWFPLTYGQAVAEGVLNSLVLNNHFFSEVFLNLCRWGDDNSFIRRLPLLLLPGQYNADFGIFGQASVQTNASIARNLSINTGTGSCQIISADGLQIIDLTPPSAKVLVNTGDIRGLLSNVKNQFVFDSTVLFGSRNLFQAQVKMSRVDNPGMIPSNGSPFFTEIAQYGIAFDGSRQ